MSAQSEDLAVPLQYERPYSDLKSSTIPLSSGDHYKLLTGPTIDIDQHSLKPDISDLNDESNGSSLVPAGEDDPVSGNNAFFSKGRSPQLIEHSQAPKAGSKADEALLETEPSLSPAQDSRSSSRRETNRPKGRFARFGQALSHLTLDTWWAETVSWIFSAICVIGIIIILNTHNHQPLPKWPYNITLNTMVTLFVTLATTALMVPVSRCISQLKWIWFIGPSQKASDLELFDQASRGIYGSIRLAGSSVGGVLSSFWALITILVLAVNAVTQQTIRYVPVLVSDPKDGSAICPRSTYFATIDPLPTIYTYYIDASTQAAIYTAYSSKNKTESHLRLRCSTGNCEWPEYQTLGVCASLANVTERLTVNCTDQPAYRYCEAGLPGMQRIVTQGYFSSPQIVVQSTKSIFEQHDASVGHHHAKSQAFENVLRNSLLNFLVIWDADWNYTSGYHNGILSGDVRGPQAAEINFQYCVQNQSSGVTRGEPWTHVTSWYTDFHAEGDLIEFRSSANWTAKLPSTGERYPIGIQFVTAISDYMSQQFEGETDFNSDSVDEVQGARGVKAVIDAITQPPYHIEGLKILATNLATSLTNNFRSQAVLPSPVIGKALLNVSYVQIAWPWITLLVFIEIASLIFLIYVIVENKRKGCEVWMESNLALIQALDVQSKRDVDFIGLGTNVDIRRRAERINFKLKDDGLGWKLVQA